MSTSDEIRTLIKLRFGSIPADPKLRRRYILNLPIDFRVKYRYAAEWIGRKGQVYSLEKWQSATVENLEQDLYGYINENL